MSETVSLDFSVNIDLEIDMQVVVYTRNGELLYRPLVDLNLWFKGSPVMQIKAAFEFEMPDYVQAGQATYGDDFVCVTTIRQAISMAANLDEEAMLPYSVLATA